MTYQFGETEIIISPTGEEFPISAMYSIFDIGGRGVPDSEITTVRGYQQPSETVLDWVVQPRTISMNVGWQSTDRASYWSFRHELTDFLRINQGGPLTLRHIRDGVSRDILAYARGPFFESDIDDWESPSLSIEFVCHDPLFSDSSWTTLTVTPVAISTLRLPFTLPMLIESREYVGTFSINYSGTFPAYPVIRVNGPCSSFTIVNESTGKLIKLLGQIDADKWVEIDTSIGNVSITNSEGVDEFYRLALPESDPVGFNLRGRGIASGMNPFDGVSGGLNVLRAYAPGLVVGSTSVQLSYRSRYLSID